MSGSLLSLLLRGLQPLVDMVLFRAPQGSLQLCPDTSTLQPVRQQQQRQHVCVVSPARLMDDAQKGVCPAFQPNTSVPATQHCNTTDCRCTMMVSMFLQQAMQPLCSSRRSSV